MRNLLATTALAVAMASAASAQSTPQPPLQPPAAATASGSAASLAYLARGEAGDVHVTDLIGATLYAADADETTVASRDDWESVGVVEDVLLTRGGDVRAILVEVGAFLGMGGKTIAAPLGAVRYVTDGADAEGDAYFLVMTANRETLQGAPAYDRPSIRAEDETMTATSPTMHAGATAPIFAHEGYARADGHAMTASDLEKASVYGGDDAKIGAISALIMNKDGKISAAVIEVGGFLGLGAHPVSMPFADLTVLRETGGDELRVYIDATKETLKAMPAYKS